MVRQTSLAGQPIRKREEAGVQEDGLVKGGYKIESSYVTIRKHRGGTSPRSPHGSYAYGKGLVSRLYAICTAAARSAAQSDLSTSLPILWSYLNTQTDQSDACSLFLINCYDRQPHEDLAPGWSERVVGTTPTVY